ncbi:MAG: alcohol dehydrogenase catalytic domain-containing protein [Verrucomicrobia bacterium]|nr:alcohol dehydrogenase catalytic domain-containing protein [Verrucomicrobiota bacterium]MDA1086854.1 alcohol dehydrogenase catalytic domain-containing protein [Verrucomicrobiota bacterium]
MNAAILTGIRRIELGEWPDPQIESDTDVLLAVRVVGVCGSDVHYYAEGGIGATRVEYPHIIGHEISGEVLEVGTSVTRVKPGDLVAVDPCITCGTCGQCVAGRPQTCLDQRFRSFPGQADGCLSERVVMPEHCCYPVAADMTPEQASLCEPLSVGIYAARLAGPVLQDARVAILGAGPIGLSVLLAARAAGTHFMAVTDKLPQRIRAAAAGGGADWSGLPQELDAAVDSGSVEPFDLVYECCGDQAALDQAIDLLVPGGELLIAGIPEGNRISFDINQLRRKEIRIQNVRRQNDCVQEAVQLLADRAIDADFMITHHYPFEKTQEAFELVSEYGDGVIKAMIEVS